MFSKKIAHTHPRKRFYYDQLQKKVAIVTGGESGIGRETCLQLAKKGARIAVINISDDRETPASI